VLRALVLYDKLSFIHTVATWAYTHAQSISIFTHYIFHFVKRNVQTNAFHYPEM